MVRAKSWSWLVLVVGALWCVPVWGQDLELYPQRVEQVDRERVDALVAAVTSQTEIDPGAQAEALALYAQCQEGLDRWAQLAQRINDATEALEEARGQVVAPRRVLTGLAQAPRADALSELTRRQLADAEQAALRAVETARSEREATREEVERAVQARRTELEALKVAREQLWAASEGFGSGSYVEGAWVENAQRVLQLVQLRLSKRRLVAGALERARLRLEADRLRRRAAAFAWRLPWLEQVARAWADVHLARRRLDAERVAAVVEVGEGVLEQQLTWVRSNEDLDEASQELIAGVYTEAQELLRQASGWRSRAEEFERQVAEAPARIELIREELAKPLEAPTPEVPEQATRSEIDQLQAQAEAQLVAARQLLDELREEPEGRVERRRELAELIARSRQQLQDLREGLGMAIPPDSPYERALSRRYRTLARQDALDAELRAHEAELRSLDASNDLRQARRDRALRRVALAEQLVHAWEEVAAETRRREAEEATAQARRLVTEAAEHSVRLGELARNNQELAARRSGEEGLTVKLQQVTRELNQARVRLAELRDRFRSVRRKVEAAGLTNAMGILLRKQYEDLPSSAELARGSRQRQESISEIQYQLIVLEELREQAGDLEGQLQEIMAEVEVEGEGRADVETVARRVLVTRRDQIRALNDDYTQLLNRELELVQLVGTEVQAIEEYRGYIEQRILWVRSIEGGMLPSVGDSGSAVSWLLTAPGWAEAWPNTREFLGERWPTALLWLVLVGGAWGVRLRYRGRYAVWSEPLKKARTDSMSFTSWTLGLTLVSAAAWPLTFAAAAWSLMASASQAPVGTQVGLGLWSVAGWGAVLLVLQHAVRPGGLAEKHFRWREGGLERLRECLRWFVPVKLVATFLEVALDGFGERAYGEALGRLVFMAQAVALAVFAWRVLHPRGVVLERFLTEHADGWVRRLRHVWFPLSVGLPALWALLALQGYYYTGRRLQGCLDATLALVAVLVLCHALFLRWLGVVRRKRRLAEAERKREEAQSESKSGDEFPSFDADEGVDVASMSEQSQQLFRSVVAVVLFAGIYGFWIETLPALKRLEQVQLWPELTLLEDEEKSRTYPALEASARQPAAEVAAEGDDEAVPAGGSQEGSTSSEEETAEAAPASPLPMPGVPSAQAPKEESPKAAADRVTLADLLAAIVAMVLTVVLTRNIPALLEIVLLERLPLDSGARYAINNLVRYVIVLVGVSISFGLVGIGWAKLQWLAAALTFGLGFGLQEIFANFVSGLILLFERPVRIGDRVTVNGVSGTVSKIRIRATTIVDWDMKELIIPNRALITGQVVNWSLSEETLRQVFPIGIAYGSDVELAKSLMLQIAKEHEFVLDDPAPMCVFKGFGASSLDFDLRVYMPHTKHFSQVMDEINTRIDKAFRENGIEIPFSQHDVWIRSQGGAPTPELPGPGA